MADLSALEKTRHAFTKSAANILLWRCGMKLQMRNRGGGLAPPFKKVSIKMKIKKTAVKTAVKSNDQPTITSAASTASSATRAMTTAPAATSATKPATPKPSGNGATQALTTIDVKLDVGFGNSVFLRGQGAGLTWEQGQPLVCVDGKTWRWTGEIKAPITFKLLINDKIWSAGNDLMITPGQKLEIAPEFA